MCGRYASTRSAADLAALFDADDETDGDLVPDYNIAPTDPAPIVRLSSRSDRPILTVARWGLVPAWSITWLTETEPIEETSIMNSPL